MYTPADSSQPCTSTGSCTTTLRRVSSAPDRSATPPESSARGSFYSVGGLPSVVSQMLRASACSATSKGIRSSHAMAE